MSQIANDNSFAQPVEPMPPQVLRAKASREYGQQSREALEEQLILSHLPLVRHVVQKIASHLSHREDLDDLISAGTVGLVRAAKAFDPTKDAEFKTYAYIRIRGAVLDELRTRSFVPSSIRKEIGTIRKAFERLQEVHGRPPGDEELAREVGLSGEQLYQKLEEARRQHFLSINGLSDEGPVLGDILPSQAESSPQDHVEQQEMMEQLASAMAALPEKERLVLLLYYERDLTMKEAAKVLGVTESRVSQIHASALFKLSMQMGERT